MLEFTITNVSGLGAGESLEVVNLLSQNGSSENAAQTGGFGGTFGQLAGDSVTLTSDNGSTSVVNQSDDGDLGASLLNTDSGTAATGNTFAHSANNLGFTNSFTVQLTDANNQAVVVQGFQFAVVSGSFLKGDVDMSGVVDFGDIPPFIAVLQSGDFQVEADVDCNTVVDFGDIPAFIAVLQGQ